MKWNGESKYLYIYSFLFHNPPSKSNRICSNSFRLLQCEYIDAQTWRICRWFNAVACLTRYTFPQRLLLSVRYMRNILLSDIAVALFSSSLTNIIIDVRHSICHYIVHIASETEHTYFSQILVSFTFLFVSN